MERGSEKEKGIKRRLEEKERDTDVKRNEHYCERIVTLSLLRQCGGSDNGSIFREVNRMRTLLQSERDRERDFVQRVEQLCEKMRVQRERRERQRHREIQSHRKTDTKRQRNR